jgi:hypothetical protein
MRRAWLLACAGALALAPACNGGNALGAAAQLGGHAAGAALGAAASPGPRPRDTYAYRAQLAQAMNQCAAPTTAQEQLVLDAADHLKSSADAVRVVRFTDCRITWLDDCSFTRPALYGAPRELEGERARVIDVWDDVDLYERVPAWSTAWGSRVRGGAHLRVDLVTATARETKVEPRRADLASEDACAGATHYLAAVLYGAVRVNVDPQPNLTERELDAQATLDLGGYAACRREEGPCLAPVAVKLVPLPR